MKSIKLPTELTAENGAKGALMGEFLESIELDCPECECGDWDDDCEICNGSGSYVQSVTVQWSTIKEIYAKTVKHFESTGMEVSP